MKKKSQIATDKIQKRLRLKETLFRKSELVQKESMAVLKKFEKMENESKRSQL